MTLFRGGFGASLRVLIVLSCVLTFPAHANKSELLDKIMVIVDDDIVMQSELDQRIDTISLRLQRQGTPLPPRSILETRVLDQLILESIQLQRAATAGVRISDDQLNQTLQNIARSNNMTLDQFEVQLAQDGETYTSAREQIRREMLITRVQQSSVDRRVRVSEQEVEHFLASKEGREKSGMEYLLGHILISVPESASEEELQDAMGRLDQVYAKLEAGVDFTQVAVELSDGRRALEGGIIGWRKENELPSIALDVLPGLAIREASKPLRSPSGFHVITALEKRGGVQQIVDQYRVRHILISPNEIRTNDEAKVLSEKLYDRIDNGEDFALLARSNSDDPVSAIDGGDLNWVNLGQMVPEFEQKMLESPIGVVSQPFESQFGWHILQVTETRKQDVGALLQSQQARQVIHRRKYEEELAAWLLEIKSEAFIDVKDERFIELENKSE